jgi:hypothetical protein
VAYEGAFILLTYDVQTAEERAVVDDSYRSS